MNGSSSTYFQKLNLDEKKSKLSQLSRGKLEITIWSKGNKNRETLSTVEFSRDRLELICSLERKSQFVGLEVLYTFKLNGLSFFGKGQFKSLDSNRAVLDCSEDLFKSERRATFRLLTYPHHEAYVLVKIPEAQKDGSNLVQMRTGLSQTGLFKSFLNLLKDDEDTPFHKGYFPFRILDISVTGLAFQVGEMERKYFPKGEKTGPLYIDFNGQEISIKNSEIMYVSDLILPKSKNHKSLKIGIKFLNVDINTDQLIGKLINSALRDFESEFEDFIK